MSCPTDTPSSWKVAVTAAVTAAPQEYDTGYDEERGEAWRTPRGKRHAVPEWTHDFILEEDLMNPPQAQWPGGFTAVCSTITSDDIARRQSGKPLDRVAPLRPTKSKAAAKGAPKAVAARTDDLPPGTDDSPRLPPPPIARDLPVEVSALGEQVRLKYAPEKGKPSPLIQLMVNGKQRCQVTIYNLAGGVEHAVAIGMHLMNGYVNGEIATADLFSRRNAMEEQSERNELDLSVLPVGHAAARGPSTAHTTDAASTTAVGAADPEAQASAAPLATPEAQASAAPSETDPLEEVFGIAEAEDEEEEEELEDEEEEEEEDADDEDSD
jgi:hypothetical protein